MRAAMLLLLTALAACGSDPDPLPEDEVAVSGSAFIPTNRTVHTSQTVTFVNEDATAHNVTSTDVPAGAAPFALPLPANGSVTVTPTIAGTYQYYCTIHGTPTTGMHGTLTVVVP